jgi:rhodanese-related sulfurtransferase
VRRHGVGRSAVSGARQEIEVRDAAALLEQGGAVALDVREMLEWEAGRIPGALHVPLRTLGARLPEIPKDRRIVAVCRSGNRSGLVTEELARRGYRIENLAGGMKAWVAAGLPLEPADGSVV